MPVQPRTPPGVLELLPPQQLAFQRMLDIIRRGFERFGFVPVETPVFELTKVLLTKSGGDTEKQVYFVQSTGALKQAEDGGAELPELALRFDLTVPLARYVAEHEPQLNFPFRRYQIQRVYRGERAQKGRYREFYQCDIDVIGKDTLPLEHDADIPAVIYDIFDKLAPQLGLGRFKIYINNRKLLRGLLESLEFAEENHAHILHEIDRVGKQDANVIAGGLVDGPNLLAGGIDPAKQARNVSTLFDLIAEHGREARATLEALRRFERPSPTLLDGIDELGRVYDGVLALGVPESALQINLAIARGLDYYTGTVYETLLDDHPKLGSICSGGRYDNLAGHYTKSKLPGVGISIGATRLFSQALELAKTQSRPILGAAPQAVAHVIILAVEPAMTLELSALATMLRDGGLNVEVYRGQDALGKQLKYADRSRIPLAVLYGSREEENGVVMVKNLRETVSTKQLAVPLAELVPGIKRILAGQALETVHSASTAG